MANWQDCDWPGTDIGFTGVPGHNHKWSLLYYLSLFIKDEDYQTMADETNRYAD